MIATIAIIVKRRITMLAIAPLPEAKAIAVAIHIKMIPMNPIATPKREVINRFFHSFLIISQVCMKRSPKEARC